MTGDRLRLIKHDPATGQVTYEGFVPLGDGRSLTFHVEGNTGAAGDLPRVKLKFDAHQAETFNIAMARMGDWLEAASGVFRGSPEPGPPARWVKKESK